VLWRLAARLITGPLAFFIAGVVDMGALAVATIRGSIRRRSKRWSRPAARVRIGRRIPASRGSDPVAVTASVLSEVQRQTLEAVCDTVVPAVQSDVEDPVLRDFLGRAASELGVAEQIEGLIGQMPPEQMQGFADLLDGLAQSDLANLPLEARTRVLHDVAASSHEARLGVLALRNSTFLFFYGLTDEGGRNPNWDAIGYPGPLSAPPSPQQAPKTIPVLETEDDEQTLTTDVCVIESGAGGAVIAAQLQAAGKSVLVLEMGGYRNESDFKQLELPGLFELYLGAGLLSSEDGSIAVFAGSTLGGGTVVNYMNCLRTPDPIRREWADQGIDGLDEPPYDEHIDAVLTRIGATDAATTQNRQHKKMIRALDALGIPHRPIVRNVDTACEDPRVCGYCLTGCQKGCKQSTMKTFLQDASDAGARFVVGCHADQILVSDGRASGVEATVTKPNGSTAKLTVHAPTVVVACGSIESPALLLRSGIGGPAVGKHLRLHPAAIVNGIYDEPIEAWIGQIQSEVSDHFSHCDGDHGFLIESVGAMPGVHAAGIPWRDGEEHKREFARMFGHHAPFLSVARDHGEGEVVLDPHGQPVVRWSLSDDVDRRLFIRANVELARLHHAVGAPEIRTLHADEMSWRRDSGEPFEQFVDRIEQAPYGAADVTIFTAHQMGSCRMGSDPSDSVADGRGELHDVRGVWIGDASAFPTAPGVNPMVSIMSLARRTARMIAAD
jgi:choline dehydrogenase-like flavoprotein